MFYSHPKKDIEHHLLNVKNIAQAHLHKYAMRNYPLEYLISNITELHDLGKYTDFFQEFITGKDRTNKPEKNHSRLGAYVALNKIYDTLDIDEEKKKFLASMSMLLILWHHQNLQNPLHSEIYKGISETAREIFEIQKENLSLKNEVPYLKENLKYLFIPDKKKFGRYWHNFRKQTPQEPEQYFLFNYLFSLLTEADKLDASDTEVYNQKEIDVSVVENFIKTLEKNELSEIRTKARKEVISQIEKINLERERLFTLTAPTGIGKTLTALDFAINLRDKIHKHRGYIPQIIYALPFINIIEQNLGVYKDVLGDKAKILAHYQLVDVFSQNEDIENEASISTYDKLKMQLDTWQSDIVITTFVQFFKTLITGKNKLLKKFNHYAGSIIILDEIQTMPLDILPLIGIMLFYLSQYLDTYIIVMTATQPGLFNLAEKLYQPENKISVRELLPENRKYFGFFKRTRIYPLINSIIKTSDEFAEIFSQYWDKDKSALIVCNTVNRSLEVYNSLKERYSDIPIYYLSTNILPVERKKRVNEIKKRLDNNEKLILVSTQVVEAGVDLDFDMAFRDIGPIDAIVQIAGRVNRGAKKQEYAPLYVINFENDAERIYGKVTVSQAYKTLSKYEFIDETMYKSLVEDYFNILADKTSFEDYTELFDHIKRLNYNEIEKFDVIKGKNVLSIFVEIDDIATEVLEAYRKMQNHELDKNLFEAKYKLDFNQRIISVPVYIETLGDLAKLDDRIKLIPKYLLDTYYDPDIGFKRKLDGQATIL